MQTMFLMPLVALVFTSGDVEPLDGLIKKLSSISFRERDKATKILEELPEAALLLRKAAPVADLETRRRIEAIIRHVEQKSARELNSVIDAGRIDRAISLLVNWPKGKDEFQALDAMGRLVRRIDELTGDQWQYRNEAIGIVGGNRPVVVCEKHVTESISVEGAENYFVRTHEFDLDVFRIKRLLEMRNYRMEGIQLFRSCIVVSSGSVHAFSGGSGARVIFAGKKVRITDGSEFNLIVSCEDAKFDGDLNNSVVIARGSVELSGRLTKSQIISGASVKYDKDRMSDCVIIENEPIPLGFIRWSDPPKVKERRKRSSVLVPMPTNGN